jgi:uncharacterized damage-inducible protein DinB
MPELDGYLHQLDHAWSHAFESVASALDGVTEEEAFWQAPCYAAEEREDGWPPPGTIAWQLAHLAHCKRHYTDCFLQPPGTSERPEVTPWTPCDSLAELRAVLEDVHAGQRAAIAGLGEERLGETAADGTPFREFLSMCIRHDTWHASQIAVARRLYRTRG